MNKREAKRDACFHAALIVQSAIDNGWEIEDRYEDPADLRRFLDALNELLDELNRRGAKP